ncbi:hypothetical protein [Marinicellulosiphila megalodicopiae]|uniref:hypothetical protein n=1 Tax=Marinicellulosiphila megalodicopiae TaxID=2724896 RepID=UPI003BB21088
MKLLVLSGWNTPAHLIEAFCRPVAKSLNIECELLNYTGAQISFEAQIQKWDTQYKNETLLIVAWSLGGNLALKWQETNPNIQSVVTVATNLQFVDEQLGMAPKQYKQFCQGFENPNPILQKKFLQLVCQGAPKPLIKQLKSVYAESTVDIKTLHRSLLWLDEIKLDQHKVNANTHNQHWFAKQDVLVPSDASSLFDNSRVFEGSHAFFLEDEALYQNYLISCFESLAENA